MDALSGLSELLRKSEQQHSLNSIKTKQRKEIVKENLKRSIHDRGFLDDLESIQDYYTVKVIKWIHIADVIVMSYNHCTMCDSKNVSVESIVSVSKDSKAETYDIKVIDNETINKSSKLYYHHINTQENPKKLTVCHECTRTIGHKYETDNTTIKELLSKFGA